ncbi:hypothetical protein EMN47_18910 [Prolixibacteraceae bacterium JC049]|nr:hypothetical protein [Prolixibacteraceae bacterium JC049]
MITITCNLHSVLIMDLENNNIQFEFTSTDEYVNGLKGTDFVSNGKVISTTDWALSYRAMTPLTHEDGVSTIPSNNIGVKVQMDNQQSTTSRRSRRSLASFAPIESGSDIVPLSTSETVLHKHVIAASKIQPAMMMMSAPTAYAKSTTTTTTSSSSTSTKGEHDFSLFWQMGTRSGGMNGKSLKDQNLKKGVYTAEVELRVTELMK